MYITCFRKPKVKLLKAKVELLKAKAAKVKLLVNNSEVKSVVSHGKIIATQHLLVIFYLLRIALTNYVTLYSQTNLCPFFVDLIDLIDIIDIIDPIDPIDLIDLEYIS